MIKIVTITRPLALLTRRWVSRFGTFKFPLPDLGEKIKEGRVKKLYVKQGDRVGQFQKLADVQSDKQFTEISSPEEGVIRRLYYREDETCQVGDIFLDIETQGQTKEQPVQSKEKKIEAPKLQPVFQPSAETKEILTSPTVIMWSKDHKVDLRDVVGTGRKGRILKGDIIQFIQNRKNQPIRARIIPEEKVEVGRQVLKVSMTESDIERHKMATYSATIPHLFLEQIFDVTDVIPIVQASLARKQPISLLSIIIKAFSMAISAHPRINTIYKMNNQFNYSLASQQNVLVPIYGKSGLGYSLLAGLEKQSIISLQKTLDSNDQGQNEAKKIKQMVSKATICLSYIGATGIMTMNPPILGETICHASIGEVRDVAISNKGRQQKRKHVSVILGADHRVMDGASVARFGKTWKQYSEQPTTAFLNMI